MAMASPKRSTDTAGAASSRMMKSGLRPSRSFVQGAIEAMARTRAEKGHCTFAFTAPNRRAGTTYVVSLLADELVAQFDATVAVVPADALKNCDPKRLPQGFTEQSHKLWKAVPDETLEHMPDFALENVWISADAKNFDFILIDCPSLDFNPLALRWASEVDGVVLVLQAGETRLEQIDTAQRLLRSSPGRLAGMILNKRTYPIPKFLYKLL